MSLWYLQMKCFMTTHVYEMCALKMMNIVLLLCYYSVKMYLNDIRL